MASDQSLDQRILKALGHPLRQRVLAEYNERVSSPRAVADALGEPLGNVAYHSRILRDADCIELVRTEPRRGAVEHFYRATVRPHLTDEQWRELPVDVRRGIFGNILDVVRRDVTGAAQAGGFDDVETHVSRTVLRLDEQGWDDTTALLNDALEEAIRISAESTNRAAASSEVELGNTELAMLHFVRDDAASGDA